MHSGTCTKQMITNNPPRSTYATRPARSLTSLNRTWAAGRRCTARKVTKQVARAAGTGPTTAQQLPAELVRARHIKSAGLRASAIALGAGLTTAWVQGIELPQVGQWLIAVPLLGGAVASFPLVVAVTQDKAQVELHNGRLYLQWGAPSKGTPLAEGSIEVKPTNDKRGNGAFAVKAIPAGSYLGDYEGEMLNEAAYWARYPSGMSDYCIRVDQDCSIDGSSRAKDTSRFSPCHMNHSSQRHNVVRNTSRKHQRVSFFTEHDVQVGEELLLDYGAQYWKTREDQMLE